MSRLLVTQLGVVCGPCETLNPPGAQRCSACAAPIAAATVPPPAVRAPSRPATPAATPSPARSPAVPVPSRFIVGVVAGPARGQRFRLMANGCTVGRTRGAILFAEDPFVSAQHAAFRIRGGRLSVRDEGSLSGVFVSIGLPEPLLPGTLFAAGPRLFRYLGPLVPPPAAPGVPRVYGSPVPSGVLHGLEEVLVGGRSGRTIVTAQGALSIGLGGCDLNFPQDAGLAPRHCELGLTAAGAVLRDLSAGLGTFVRLAGQERPLEGGDRVRIGQETLVVDLAA